MPGDSGIIELLFRARLDQLDKDMGEGRKKAVKAAEDMGAEMEAKVGAKLAGVGKTLTKTLTPVAGTIGVGMGLAFKEFDSGADAITARAGLVGADMDAALSSMKDIGGQVNAPLSQIGETLADVASAAGLTGKPLEEVAGRLVRLAEMGQRVSGQDVGQFLKNWGIGAEEAGPAMDRLFAVSQKTGVGVDKLLGEVTSAGPILREFGLSWDQAAGLVAKMEQQGVPTSDAIRGMQRALVEGAKSGKDANVVLAETVEKIKGAGDQASANAAAIDVFGAKAGPQLAALIRQGTLGVADFTAALPPAEEQISKTYKATLDWGDKLELLKNKVIGVIGPVGEYGMAISGIAAGAGPVLQGAGKLAAHFTASGVAAAGATAPTVGFGAAMWAATWPILAVIAAMASIAGAVYLVIRNWDTIKEATGAAWSWIEDHVDEAVRLILFAVTGGLSEVVLAVVHNFDRIKSAVLTGVMFIVDNFLHMAELTTSLAAKAFGWVPGVGPKLRAAAGAVAEFRDDVNAYLEGIRDKDIHVRIYETTYIQTVYGEEVRSGSGGRQTAYAVGGFINHPTLALMGEAGRELVLPLTDMDRTRELLAQAGLLGESSDLGDMGHWGGDGDGGGGNVTVIVQGSVVSERELVDAVRRGIAGTSRYTGSPGF